MKVQLCAAADAGREPVAAWILDGGHQLAAGGEPADVAVADVAMGPATAIAACSEAAIPVLAINARDDDVAALIAAGVHDILPPPVTRASRASRRERAPAHWMLLPAALFSMPRRMRSS